MRGDRRGRLHAVVALGFLSAAVPHFTATATEASLIPAGLPLRPRPALPPQPARLPGD